MNEVEKAIANLAPGVRQQMEDSFSRLSIQQLLEKQTSLISERDKLRRERAANLNPELDRRIMALNVETAIFNKYVDNNFS
jgi:hypothetical protein